MLQSFDARTGKATGNARPGSTPTDIDAAVTAAALADDAFAASSAHERGALLRALADALESDRAGLVAVADCETGLGLPRLSGEIDRTTFQRRGFADLLSAGTIHAVLDEQAIAGPPPGGRPHLTRTGAPLGSVAMFSPSNFPFAFSVLGGDTASAMAAGSPVVVKGHPAHPELSRRTAALAQRVVIAQGFPVGVLQFVQGASVDVGVALVNAPAIAVVAFTGSFKGGTALAKLAAERPRPISFLRRIGFDQPAGDAACSVGERQCRAGRSPWLGPSVSAQASSVPARAWSWRPSVQPAMGSSKT